MNKKVCIVGGGVIGGGWAARFLLNGWEVDVYDPQPDTEVRIKEILVNARASLPLIADVPMPQEGELRFVSTLAEAVKDADWIQESVPERLELKHKVIAEIQKYATTESIVASSTSGFKPSELQQHAANKEQILVAHPFNPVYLLPLVELVPGNHVSTSVAQRATDILTSIGMKALLVRTEIDAHIADRFLEAVWREALWLVNDDVATTEEIDDAIRFGFGLRWGQMGLFETYRLAGGEEGMAHFIRQFGPALKWPWTKLMDVPELTEDLVQKIASQSDAQSGGYTLRELERIRDRNLVGFLRSLKQNNWGAGITLNDHDKRMIHDDSHETLNVTQSAPLRILEFTVLPAWIDYNGHMTDFRYAQVFSESCDRLLLTIGMDKDYVADGYSYYTVESHIMYLDEVGVNESMYTTCQVLQADAKRIRAFFRLHAGSDHRVLANCEQLYLHVNRDIGKVCEASEEIQKTLIEITRLHAALPKPDAAGRYVGQPKER